MIRVIGGKKTVLPQSAQRTQRGVADQIARWRGPFEEALFLCDLCDLCGKNAPMNANQPWHRTAAPCRTSDDSRFLGHGIGCRCPGPGGGR